MYCTRVWALWWDGGNQPCTHRNGCFQTILSLDYAASQRRKVFQLFSIPAGRWTLSRSMQVTHNNKHSINQSKYHNFRQYRKAVKDVRHVSFRIFPLMQMATMNTCMNARCYLLHSCERANHCNAYSKHLEQMSQLEREFSVLCVLHWHFPVSKYFKSDIRRHSWRNHHFQTDVV